MRLDEHTVLVANYDDLISLYNDRYFKQQKHNETKTMRGSKKNILVLQELLPEDGTVSTGATKVSELCFYDLNGDIGDSLSLSKLKSAMSTIKEMQDFFPAPDVQNDKRRSDSIDIDIMSEDEGYVGGFSEARLDGFQLLLKDADNMVDQVGGEEEEVYGNNVEETEEAIPDTTYKYGAFVMWLAKNYPDEFFHLSGPTRHEETEENLSQQRAGPEMRQKRKGNTLLAPTRLRLMEFRDPDTEAEYFEYLFLSNKKALKTYTNVGLCHCVIMNMIFLIMILGESKRVTLYIFLALNFVFGYLRVKMQKSVNKGAVHHKLIFFISLLVFVTNLISIPLLVSSEIWHAKKVSGNNSSRMGHEERGDESMMTALRTSKRPFARIRPTLSVG